MPVEIRNPATSKGNLFSATIKGWNALMFVTSSSFLDVTVFLPYTKWTLPHLWWITLQQKLGASLTLRLKVLMRNFCIFTYPFFKFWIIVQGFQRKTELCFFKILQFKHLNLFGTTLTFINPFALSKAKQ